VRAKTSLFYGCCAGDERPGIFVAQADAGSGVVEADVAAAAEAREKYFELVGCGEIAENGFVRLDMQPSLHVKFPLV